MVRALAFSLAALLAQVALAPPLAAQSDNAPAPAPIAVGMPVPVTVLGRLDDATVQAVRTSIAACWNVVRLDGAARAAVVDIALDLTPDARPVEGTIRLVAPREPTVAEGIAFETARRAIIRCGAGGFPLPREAYALWQSMILTFDARVAR
jgi:hypothetical protein